MVSGTGDKVSTPAKSNEDINTTQSTFSSSTVNQSQSESVDKNPEPSSEKKKKSKKNKSGNESEQINSAPTKVESEDINKKSLTMADLQPHMQSFQNTIKNVEAKAQTQLSEQNKQISQMIDKKAFSELGNKIIDMYKQFESL